MVTERHRPVKVALSNLDGDEQGSMQSSWGMNCVRLLLSDGDGTMPCTVATHVPRDTIPSLWDVLDLEDYTIGTTSYMTSFGNLDVADCTRHSETDGSYYYCNEIILCAWTFVSNPGKDLNPNPPDPDKPKLDPPPDVQAPSYARQEPIILGATRHNKKWSTCGCGMNSDGIVLGASSR
jgi:hypothetical protein